MIMWSEHLELTKGVPVFVLTVYVQSSTVLFLPYLRLSKILGLNVVEIPTFGLLVGF